jgi:hypothetical protein
VALEKQKQEVKKFYENLKEATEALVKESGVGSYFIDEEGIVYGIIEPEGRFIYYEKYDVIRTRRPGETRGTLSLKEAKERGFTPAE